MRREVCIFECLALSCNPFIFGSFILESAQGQSLDIPAGGSLSLLTSTAAKFWDVCDCLPKHPRTCIPSRCRKRSDTLVAECCSAPAQTHAAQRQPVHPFPHRWRRPNKPQSPPTYARPHPRGPRLGLANN